MRSIGMDTLLAFAVRMARIVAGAKLTTVYRPDTTSLGDPTMMQRAYLLAAVLGVTALAAEPAADKGDIMFHAVKVNKVLFVGNSITKHGPAPKIGWTGNWGMAATAEDKDYVHLILKAFAEASDKQSEAMIANVATYEREYATYDLDAKLAKEFAFKADLVIVAIGENVPNPADDEAKAALLESLTKLFQKLKASGNPVILVRSCFWANAAKDAALKQACTEVGGVFVDAGPLGNDKANFASSEREIEHQGVGHHPGDRGMQAIADLILKALAEVGK